MRRELWGAAILFTLAVLWVACGGSCRVLLTGGLVLGCGDQPPGPGDPAFGTAAEVLVKDCPNGQLLWIGINAPPTPTPTPGPARAAQTTDVFDEFEQLYCAGQLNWIGGTVVVAGDHPNGFYFDPAAILVLESAPESMQTTIGAIAADPVSFAPTGNNQEQWVVPATVLAVETSEPQMCPVVPACSV